jgi:hypothetical protein
MSKIEVNTITQQCGPSLTVGGGACKSVTLDATTVTLGRCGATVSLAAGATQTGFGRTGTVDWCTTAKTAPFTGVSGKGYFVNTTCGAVTVTLPATPTAGDIISIKDYARTAATNNINFCRNGSKMDGDCSSSGISTNGDSTTLIYVDGTKGWTSILDSTTNTYGTTYITATGGTIVTCGDYKTHIFTSDGCFAVSSISNLAPKNKVDFMVIAGGGGGGSNNYPLSRGVGGGGGGGFRIFSTTPGCNSPLNNSGASPNAEITVTAQTYPITVGGGGAGAPSGSPDAGSQGTTSTFDTVSSAGGAGGGGHCNGAPTGGSGGGGRNAVCGSAGNTPPTSPPQGQNGGNGGPSSGPHGGGGGGGAGAVGETGFPGTGNGGIGSYIADPFIGPTAPSYGEGGPVSSTRYFSAGGGGGNNPTGGTGGIGGGGDADGGAGATNMGGGGAASPPGAGGAGGSGIIMIRYQFQ